MESTFDDLNKPQNNPFFPCSFDQNLLLINSPKISPSKRPNILLKHPCSAGIKPDSFNKRKPDLKINLYRGTEEGRRKKSFKTLRIPNKAPSFLTNMLRSPFLRNFYPNQSKILIKSAQLRNNEYLKEYYEEKIQTRNTEYKRKDKTSKFTKKMPYYKVFTKFSQLVIGILRLKAFIRRKKTEKYVKLFSEHLKGGFYHNYIDNLPPIDLAHTYQSLIQREPFSDPYFIYVIERVSFTSIIKEFNSKKKGLYNWVILIYKAISFSCNRLVNSQGFKVITLLIVQANCYCLYREFYLLEETIPESLCVNLTGYPIQKSSYHSFNDWVIYFFLIEMILKLIALGIIEYLKDLWNIGFSFKIKPFILSFLNRGPYYTGF